MNQQKKENIRETSRTVAEYISRLPDGTETSIRSCYDALAPELGAEWVYGGQYIGWVSSRDGGVTEYISDTDLFEVLDQVEKLLGKEQIQMDFSSVEGMPLGLPYNIPFLVRKGKSTPS